MMTRNDSQIWTPIDSIYVQYSSSGRKGEKYISHDTIPHLCHIELTYACNARCIFCYNPTRAKLGDFATIDRIVRRVAESQIPHVYLIGGEPSLFPVSKLNEYIELLSKHSSVTIVTNGIRRLEGLSDKLACLGIPIHGSTPELHEFHNRHPGSFTKVVQNIEYYVNQGFDVRCIPVLTGYNYNDIYNIIALAVRLGMESVYIDRYEDGGLGALHSNDYPQLRPSRKQFQQAVTQMLKARSDFPELGGRIGFGTAIPYCLDPRLISEGLTSNCGVGDYFCAINPLGEFRMCNQSQLVFGNVLEEPIEVIWNKPDLDIFRDLQWVSEPCRSCPLLLECTAGCKVDANCSAGFCVDYAVRSQPTDSLYIPDSSSIVQKPTLAYTYPEEYRRFRPNRYMKINKKYPEKFLVTRYQTVKIDDLALKMAESILRGKIRDEKELVMRFSGEVDKEEIRLFVSRLLQVGAIDLL